MTKEQQKDDAASIAPPTIIPKTWTGSIYSSVEQLPDEFVQGIKQIEAELQMPVWALVQNDEDPDIGALSKSVYQGFFDARMEIDERKPIALLLDSGGGLPSIAYKLAKFFRKRCGSFHVLIPNYAKSAATLLALGAEKIVLGNYAELGPLDIQVHDPEEEAKVSALNHVQTLERLSAFALKTLDESVYLIQVRSQKKISSALPHAIDFTAAMIRPLMENVDIVRYTEMSRLLKIGEDYAKRLLAKKYGQKKADSIAASLVGKYPEHGFIIDAEECEAIGLSVETPQGVISNAYTQLLPFLDNLTVLGKLKECQK